MGAMDISKIIVQRDTGLTLYAIIRRMSDLYVLDKDSYDTLLAAGSDVNAAFEANGTWNDARVGECDVALTETAGTGIYSVDFPAGLDQGQYLVSIYDQLGGAPDTDDDLVGGIEVAWSGTRVILSIHEADNNTQYLT